MTGAGDALIAGTPFSLHSGSGLVESVRIGCLLAGLTTEATPPVHHELSPELLERSKSRLSLPTGARPAAGRSAGTTVSATMRVAELAGIGIFATGGIGGVHREAEATFDISADLTELGRTGTAVVCAGVKSILDIPKTLEYLETQRVPVIVFGSDEFPAFYTRSSGIRVDHRLDTPEAIAETIGLHRRLGSRPWSDEAGAVGE